MGKRKHDRLILTCIHQISVLILKISLIHFVFSDIGEMGDTGHIVFIGRKGDHMTFKHGGDKIYPKHITDVASSHPNIFESAVSLTNQNVKFTLNQSISFKIFYPQ